MIKVIKITLLSIICVALIGFMITLINNGFDFSKIKPKQIFDESYELGNINKITVDTKSSDINIYESEDEDIKVEVYAGEKQEVEVTNENDTLSIYLKNKTRVCFGICFGSKINIYVPSSYVGSFDIETKSGDITSKLKSFNEYVINVTSGDIELKNAASLKGHATSGDIEIRKLNNFIEIKTTSGDIEINEFEVNDNSSIKVTSGDVEIKKCTNAYVEGSAKSGDIKIKKNDRLAKYELKIKTTSGDIEVN